MSSANVNEELQKHDVGMAFGVIRQTVNLADFTDGGGATGTKTLSKKIPKNSLVVMTKATVNTGFTGGGTALMQVGENGGDINAYSNSSTFNVAATAAATVLPIVTTGQVNMPIADKTVLLTVTEGGGDFTLITAGQVTVEVFYQSTDQVNTLGV